jgi:hypothetical protein
MLSCVCIEMSKGNDRRVDDNLEVSSVSVCQSVDSYTFFNLLKCTQSKLHICITGRQRPVRDLLPYLLTQL